VTLLQGNRVNLRELAAGDLEAVVAYSVDEAVARYQDWQSHTADAAKAFLDTAIAEAQQTPRTTYSLAIVERASSRLIGDATIEISSVPNKRAEIGFTLRRDHWGAGLATDASRLLLAFGFDHLGMHRIEATTHPDNVASIRVLEKLGMSSEGRMRDHLLVNGAWQESLLFSILESDWRAEPNR
jgi:[ribosomal protein S5]-alanine N-acetyltransferase